MGLEPAALVPKMLWPQCGEQGCAGRGSTPGPSASLAPWAPEAPSTCSRCPARQERQAAPVAPGSRGSDQPLSSCRNSARHRAKATLRTWVLGPCACAGPAHPPPGPGLSPGQAAGSRRKVEEEEARAVLGPLRAFLFLGNQSSPGPAPVLSGQWAACMWGSEWTPEPESCLFPRTSP